MRRNIIKLNDDEKFEIVHKKYRNICLFCKKDISVLCGTPLIYLGGCCYGITVRKVRYVFPRKAHLGCWLKKEGRKIVKVEK